MKLKWKPLITCIAIPLLLGAIAGFISKNSMSAFASLNQPPLSPSSWLFPVVWSILYILMGVASYLILSSNAPREKIKHALTLYGVQLVFNFLWPVFFFAFNLHYFSFLWLVVLWTLILSTISLFWRIHKRAAYLLVPYLLWVSFAGYLNLGIALLN